MSRLQIILAVLAVAVFTMILSSAPVSAGQEKINVCHVDGEDNYRLINVSAKAVDAHLGHDDGLVGDLVPTNPGFKFDENCNQIPAILQVSITKTITRCPVKIAAIRLEPEADTTLIVVNETGLPLTVIGSFGSTLLAPGESVEWVVESRDGFPRATSVRVTCEP